MKNKQNSKISIMLSFAYLLIMFFAPVMLAGCSFGGSKRTAGLYDSTGKLTYSWEKLIEDGIFTVSGTKLNRGENSNSEIIAGDLVLPTEITEIGKFICRDCINLTGVTIPDNVISIGQGAFQDCTNLTSVIIPKKVTEIDTRAFAGCISLTSITIPDGVTEIGRYAFADCSGLINVSLGVCVTVIGAGAFSGCTNIEYIKIPGSVIRININAFDGCENLTKVKFVNPDGWKAGDNSLMRTWVENEGKAATMLTSTYSSTAWSRSE